MTIAQFHVAYRKLETSNTEIVAMSSALFSNVNINASMNVHYVKGLGLVSLSTVTSLIILWGGPQTIPHSAYGCLPVKEEINSGNHAQFPIFFYCHFTVCCQYNSVGKNDFKSTPWHIMHILMYCVHIQLLCELLYLACCMLLLPIKKLQHDAVM